MESLLSKEKVSASAVGIYLHSGAGVQTTLGMGMILVRSFSTALQLLHLIVFARRVLCVSPAPADSGAQYGQCSRASWDGEKQRGAGDGQRSWGQW